MSSLINCHKISKTFSDKCLFNELTLAIEKKTKLGVLGPNGAGKSTLIKILSKKETTDEGTVSYAKGVKIHVVEQKSEFKSEQSISNTIKQNLENHIDALGIDISIKKLSTQLKIDDLSKNISSLSGGQKKKLAILLELEKSPDVVIFDEPTNHLDLSSVLWLEKILSKANYPWICISHDRFFLQQVAKSILEINPIFNNSHLLLSGSYDHFIKEKKVYLQDQENRFETIKNKLRKEDAWLKTSPKARTTKSKHRIEKAYDLKYQYKEIQEK
ncbi:MAG: ABC transporter ATP-binding protein, partial [Zetaproteobacteria bacterium]|nr:ABC transporter ATP-binding protein [Pseudobdellovibrionaceae bacterium]